MCETKVMKPTRKKTLIKYNLCDNESEKYVYGVNKLVR